MYKYIVAPIVIKLSAKLNIAKDCIHIKSITLEFKILSIQFQMAQANISQKLKSINLFFFFFSSLK